jgi:hypothetical protein
MTVAFIIAGVVLFDLIIVSAVLGAFVSSSFGKLTKLHPPREVEAGAVRRNFQSMSFGAANFGFCVHIAVDSFGVHFFPSAFLRWVGGKPSSVPWSHVEITDKNPGKRYVKCTLAGIKGVMPGWCFDGGE